MSSCGLTVTPSSCSALNSLLSHLCYLHHLFFWILKHMYWLNAFPETSNSCHFCFTSIESDTYVRGHPFMTSTRRGPSQCERPHRKLKLESTDVILSSSHAKKLASFLPEFRLWTEKKWRFFYDINW